MTAGKDTAVTVPALDALGTVEIELVEKAKGPDLPVPGKIVFKGRKGDPDPQFGQRRLGDRARAKGNDQGRHRGLRRLAAQGNTVYVGPGTRHAGLRPGSYDVYASRGPEYASTRRRRSR